MLEAGLGAGWLALAHNPEENRPHRVQHRRRTAPIHQGRVRRFLGVWPPGARHPETALRQVGPRHWLAFSCKRRGFCQPWAPAGCRRPRRSRSTLSLRAYRCGGGCCRCRSRCACCWPRSPSHDFDDHLIPLIATAWVRPAEPWLNNLKCSATGAGRCRPWPYRNL